jgi:Na+-driven multidrug efflux pump
MTGRVAFPKPLTMIPALGVRGIWLGTALTWTLVAAAGLIRYRSGVWRRGVRIAAEK